MLKKIKYLLIAMFMSNVSYAEVTVTAARVWPAADYTRITLESAQPIQHNLQLLKDPSRLVIDLQDAELNPVLKTITDKVLSSDPYIKQIRVAKFKPDVVRLVIDLKSEIKPELFLLKPAASYKHRLVLDIYPAQDPLMNMLTQRKSDDGALKPSPNNANPPSVPKAIVEPLPEEVKRQQTEPLSQETQGIDQKQVDAKPLDSKPVETKPLDSVAVQTETAKQQEENTSEVLSNKTDPRLITIAIDAGHGGEDPGARGANGSHEKNITLAVAKRLKAKIDAEPNMRGVLTRDGDYFIPLHGRVVKARKLQADLFVSIHADAFTNPAARGSSVFALSEKGATSASARYLAKKENESDLIGGVSLNIKDPELARTLLDLSQTATINDSLKLGKAVLGHIGKINQLHKNHVEQAAFAVLKSPDIPSILVETAFISNPEEEAKLNDDDYQDKLVESIVAGIKKYFASNPALAKTKIAAE